MASFVRIPSSACGLPTTCTAPSSTAGRSTWPPAAPVGPCPSREQSARRLLCRVWPPASRRRCSWKSRAGAMSSGTSHTIAQWRTERDYLLNTYMVQRPGIVLGQLRSAGLYPSVDAPVFQINGTYQHGGHVATGAQLVHDRRHDLVHPRRQRPASVGPGRAGGHHDHARARERPQAGPRPDRSRSNNAWRGGQAFDDSAGPPSRAVPAASAIERSSGYQQYLSIDLGQQMYNKQATCYIRIPFTHDEPDLLEPAAQDAVRRWFHRLPERDEVARRNFTGTPVEFRGQRGQPDAAAVVQTAIDISRQCEVFLKPGNNLLAIHALNGTIDSSDFLISVELVAGKARRPAARPPVWLPRPSGTRGRSRSPRAPWSKHEPSAAAPGAP